MSSALERVREKARTEKGARFTALLHHVTPEHLREAYRALRRDAAPGVDGETWASYGEDLELRLEDLHGRVHRGAFRAKPARRVYIAKADGRQRPLGIASLEDKIVQNAVAEVMNAIYEEDFLGFSYGFRKGRGQHDALDALAAGLREKKVNWVLDADIRDCFGSLDHGWLERLVEHRIADPRILRLIQKWMKAGVVENGEWEAHKQGMAQGAAISPLLANIYLHYAFDLWAEWWRRRRAQGDMIIVRYADDFIVGFEHRGDAEGFKAVLGERLRKFGLELQAEKTRLIEFGRFAAERRARRGLGKPESFDFLGFTHVSGKSRRGEFQLKRITSKKRMAGKLKQVKASLRRRRHRPVPEQGKWLARVVQGFMNYHAVPGNYEALEIFRRQVERLWRHALMRRSQRGYVTWERMKRLARRWLPRARILHPYPDERFRRQHPRQEPSAVVPLAGICAGGRP